MFSLFSRTKSKFPPIDFSRIKVDMHSHLLPGIDDGAADLANSIELIKGMVDLGYSKLITTPHILWDMYQNTTAIIEEKLELVREELIKLNIEVELHAAAEYFLDDYVEGLLAKKEKLLTLSSNLVLVEFSLAFPAMNIKEVLFELQMQGYQPVIAHPERYVYLHNQREFYEELKESGCLFQLNLLALSGQYGKTATELANYLLKNDFYSLVGSDLHHLNHIEALKRVEMTLPLARLLNSPSLLNSSL